jgi:DNA-binding response OmpR family regulator
MLHLQKYCYKWHNGFKAIVAYQGETGYKYAKKMKAIILDMKLPN